MLALTTAGVAQGLTTQENFDALREAGILDGLPGQGSLDDNITRAELAKVLQRVVGLDQGEDAAATSPSFTDVPNSAGDSLAAYGDLLGPAFVEGFARGGEFRTDRNITPEDLARIVEQVLGPGASDPGPAHVAPILSGVAGSFFGGPAGAATGGSDSAQLSDEGRRSFAAAILGALGGDRAAFAAAFPNLAADLPSGRAEDQAGTVDYSQFTTLLAAYDFDPEVLGYASKEEAINQLLRRAAGRMHTQIEDLDARKRRIMELAEARRRAQAAQGSQGGTEPPASTDPSDQSPDALRQNLAEMQEQQRQLLAEQRQREQDEAASRWRDQMAAEQAEKQQSSIWPAWVAADSRYRPLFEPRATEFSTFRASYSGEARASDGNGNSITGDFHATLDSGLMSTIYHGQIFGLNFTTDPITSSGDFIANLSSGTSVVTSGTSAQYSGGGLNGYFYGQGATGVGGTFELRGVSTDNMYGDFVGVVP